MTYYDQREEQYAARKEREKAGDVVKRRGAVLATQALTEARVHAEATKIENVAKACWAAHRGVVSRIDDRWSLFNDQAEGDHWRQVAIKAIEAGA